MPKPSVSEPRWRILARSDIDQLKRRARELHRACVAGDAKAVELVSQFHPSPPAAPAVKLSDAQLTLARAHDFPSWPKFQKAVRLFNAICDDDADEALALIRKHPQLLHERVNGVTSNWGPPLACSVQVGAENVFRALLPITGQDQQWALGRATLKGRTGMAKMLLARGAETEPDAVMGPCESLNIDGLKFLAEIGDPLTDEHGSALAPVALLLEGYFRNPPAKHACLAFFAERGIEYPDTPMMAFHLGRIDLLEEHRRRDPKLLSRRFSYREIYPLELGCHEDESLGLHGCPIDGATLLHMAADFDETVIAEWLLANGADANAKALLDAEGFGGHTVLFNIVVSQAYRSGRQRDGAFARGLLDAGAAPNAVASLRKGIRFIADESVHEYHDVTPTGFGRAFHEQDWVSREAMTEIAAAGGR